MSGPWSSCIIGQRQTDLATDQKGGAKVKAVRPKTIGELIRDGTLIDAALRQAARQALALHKRAKVPVPMWRDGKIVWIKPKDIRLPDDDASSMRTV